MPEKEPVLAPFILTQNDANITATAGTGAVWSDIWAYRVPNGVGIVLQAADIISIHFEDPGAECGTATGFADCYARIEVRDPSQEATRLVYGPSLYGRVREFQDRNTVARLAVPEPVKVYARQWIVIMGLDGLVITLAVSYFSLVTSKVAIPL